MHCSAVRLLARLREGGDTKGEETEGCRMLGVIVRSRE